MISMKATTKVLSDAEAINRRRIVARELVPNGWRWKRERRKRKFEFGSIEDADGSVKSRRLGLRYEFERSKRERMISSYAPLRSIFILFPSTVSSYIPARIRAFSRMQDSTRSNSFRRCCSSIFLKRFKAYIRQGNASLFFFAGSTRVCWRDDIGNWE